MRTTRLDDASSAIPSALRVSAALSWRLLLVLAALYVVGYAIAYLSDVTIPVALALLLSALLAPAVEALVRLWVPRWLATVVVMIGGLAAVSGVLTFVISQFVEGFPRMQRSVLDSLERLKLWLAESPLHINDQQIDYYLNQFERWLQANQDALTTGALTTAGAVTNVVTGLFLVLFTLIFFLHDGRKVWLYAIRLVPRDVRGKVDRAGVRGFKSLVGYVRATVLVAVVDAIGIWIGLAVVGVPLAVPLAALVFLGGFVPIVGAVASGAVAVLVALVSNGPFGALIILGVVLAVQQIEGNVLQPLLLGRAVKLHPLAVVLAISVGIIVFGIPGALLAVPLVAVLNAAIQSLVGRPDDEDAEPPALIPAGENRAELQESDSDGSPADQPATDGGNEPDQDKSDSASRSEQ